MHKLNPGHIIKIYFCMIILSSIVSYFVLPSGCFSSGLSAEFTYSSCTIDTIMLSSHIFASHTRKKNMYYDGIWCVIVSFCVNFILLERRYRHLSSKRVMWCMIDFHSPPVWPFLESRCCLCIICHIKFTVSKLDNKQNVYVILYYIMYCSRRREFMVSSA